MENNTIALEQLLGPHPQYSATASHMVSSAPVYSDSAIDAAIEKAFLELEGPKFVKHESPELLSPEDTDWTASILKNDCFEAPHTTESSVTSVEESTDKESHRANWETVAALKQEMANHSRMVGTYTTMKTAYLKLCKEFNYLLGLFNDNEKTKIGLIHENNQLRQMLVEVIKEREIDRQRYRESMGTKF